MVRCNPITRALLALALYICAACGPSALPGFAAPPPDDAGDDSDAGVR